MAATRPEPFRQALVHLRGRLRAGELAPGARITAKDVADALRLSPTPVREALSRLAGEGLLEERRGDGFFVPELAGPDVAALFRLSESLLLSSLERADPGSSLSEAAVLDNDPIRSVERLFFAWANASESRVIAEAFRTTLIRLAPVRRCEPELICDLAQEARALHRLHDRSELGRRRAPIRAFHARRIELADALAERLARQRSLRDDAI